MNNRVGLTKDWHSTKGQSSLPDRWSIDLGRMMVDQVSLEGRSTQVGLEQVDPSQMLVESIQLKFNRVSPTEDRPSWIT